MTLASMAMAKKRANVPITKWKSKPLALQMRGSPEWKAWLERLAAFDRGTVADVSDRALTRYAREIGFMEPPPER